MTSPAMTSPAMTGPDAEQAGQGSAAGPDRRSQLLGALAALAVQAAQAGQELGGQVTPDGGGRPRLG